MTTEQKLAAAYAALRLCLAALEPKASLQQRVKAILTACAVLK